MRFQPCQDSESRGDQYEEKILADIIQYRRLYFILTVTAYRITKVLRLLCEIILIIGVWRIRFK